MGVPSGLQEVETAQLVHLTRVGALPTFKCKAVCVRRTVGPSFYCRPAKASESDDVYSILGNRIDPAVKVTLCLDCNLGPVIHAMRHSQRRQ